eukprot:1155691-Pelagomonas_calceolata.AAC.3
MVPWAALKVSDFGLSVRMENMETHVSSLFQGTMTHMAPEVLLKGTCSKASDVYAAPAPRHPDGCAWAGEQDCRTQRQMNECGRCSVE